MLNAAFVMNRCVKSIRHLVYRLRELVSILRTSSYAHLWISKGQDFTSCLRHAHVIHMLDMASTLLARAPQGLTPRLKGASRWVAGVLVGVLCLSGTQSAEAQLDAIKSLKVLANQQLTDKQYQCHNEIVYRESRWKIDAVNGSHYGYYQMRTKSMQNKPYDYQFYIYWYYVSNRYGLDYEIPDYCKALHHLKTKGWQ